MADGWGATLEEYRRWLVGELESIGGPVDLVGHDWGGGHVVNVAMSRPDLLRSWASDALGVFDPDYVWHDLAQAWQTPEVGEAAVAAVLAENLPATAAVPGLMVLATDDHFGGTAEMRRRAAERAGARVAVLEGLGHWWMVQDPARGAAALTGFWAARSRDSLRG